MANCTKHMGMSLTKQRAQSSAIITAWNATGGTPTIDPPMTVLATLQMTWLRLATYSELLRRQVAKEGVTADALDVTSSPDASGLIGYRYGAGGKDGVVYAQSEEIRSLVALEAAERDRVVKYAKTAHDMGISSRLTDLAERWGDVVATRLTVIIESLNLTAEQSALVPGLVSQHLSNIDMSNLSGDQMPALPRGRVYDGVVSK